MSRHRLRQTGSYDQPSHSPAIPPVAVSGAVEFGAGIKRTREYQDCIRFAQRRNTREAMFRLREGQCERCPATSDLELHHLASKRSSHEDPARWKSSDASATRSTTGNGRRNWSRHARRGTSLRATTTGKRPFGRRSMADTGRRGWIRNSTHGWRGSGKVILGPESGRAGQSFSPATSMPHTSTPLLHASRSYP